MDYISHVTAYQRHKEYLRAMSKLDSFLARRPTRFFLRSALAFAAFVKENIMEPSSHIERYAAAHQRHLDAEAAEQDFQEAEEQAIERDPSDVADALDRLDGWRPVALLIGKLVSQYQYYGEERAQGLQDVSQEIYDACQPVIAEQARYNRAKAIRRKS